MRVANHLKVDVMKKCKAAVYIDAINLTKLWYVRRTEMPKCDRYEFGREIFRLSYQFVQTIVSANNERDSVKRLHTLEASTIPCWEQLKVLTSLAVELDMYKLNTAATLSELLEKIDNSVYSWRTYVARQCP